MINVAPIEFIRRVSKGGRISLKGMLLILVYYLQIILSLPFAFLQFLLYGKRIKKTIISKDPVFIWGHYRIGTTYLQKIMVCDKQFGCLTNFDALFSNSSLFFGEKMQSLFQHLINLFKIKTLSFITPLCNPLNRMKKMII